MVRFDPGNSTGPIIDLTPTFFAVAEPQVSPDATKILFSARQSPDALWQIWEMNADGTNQHQITHCPSHCLKPAFLPPGRIAYTSFSETAHGRISTVYVSEESGDGSHPITFGPGNFEVETVLKDGRILLAAATPLAASVDGHGARTLYTIHPDGTELAAFREDAHPSPAQSRAEELSDGTVVFVESRDRQRQMPGGALTWIRPVAMHNSRNFPTPSGYWSAHELDKGTLVVSRKSLGPSKSDSRFDLYAFNLEKGVVGPLIHRDPNFSSVEAVPLEKRAIPKHYWSILHPDSKTGRIICLNSYLSADAPGGRLMQTISSVRVLAHAAGNAGETVLGEAPVEADGSFYIKVPSDQPIRFELLDAKGTVLRAQKSWVWARPGEDAGCLGCHEDKALTPDNHWPMALKRMDTPFPLGASPSMQPAHSVGVK